MAEILSTQGTQDSQRGSVWSNFYAQNSYTKMTITTLFLFLIASPLMLFGGVGNNITPNANASKTGSISFSPSDKFVKAGDTFSLDVVVDPGNSSNVISNLFLKINYDKALVKPIQNCLQAKGLLVTSEQAACSDTTTSINLAAPKGDATHLLTSKQTVATLTLTALQTLNPAKTFVLFDPLTTANTPDPTEAGQNVISSLSPATINIFPLSNAPTATQNQANTTCTDVKVCPTCEAGQQCLQVCYTKKVCTEISPTSKTTLH